MKVLLKTIFGFAYTVSWLLKWNYQFFCQYIIFIIL